MTLKHYSSGNMKSARQIAIETKEALNKPVKEDDKILITKGECGLKNPCKFGKHNPNFKIEL